MHFQFVAHASIAALTLFIGGCASDVPSGTLVLSGEDVRAIHAGMMARTAEECRAGQYAEPEPYYMTPPRYPQEAARGKTEGSVTVTMTVRANGLPDDMQVVESDPAGVFDGAALKAIKQWRFKPKCTDGEFVDSAQRYTLRFKL
jgi:protein TonB